MQDEFERTRAPLMAHLLELRARLVKSCLFFVVTFTIAYYNAEEILRFLIKPLAEAEGAGRGLIYTGLAEAFVTYVKVAFFAALMVSVPVFLVQAYLFVAPGLYKTEKRVMAPFLAASPILFFLGAALAYYYVFPVAWRFFLSFETGAEQTALPVRLEARMSEYLSLVTQMVLAFGLAFQLPVALSLFSALGLVTPESLASRRRIAIVVIFIVAAILTPPDVISQICLALPLLVLYEISILGAKIASRAPVTNREAEG